MIAAPRYAQGTQPENIAARIGRIHRLIKVIGQVTVSEKTRRRTELVDDAPEYRDLFALFSIYLVIEASLEDQG